MKGFGRSQQLDGEGRSLFEFKRKEKVTEECSASEDKKPEQDAKKNPEESQKSTPEAEKKPEDKKAEESKTADTEQKKGSEAGTEAKDTDKEPEAKKKECENPDVKTKSYVAVGGDGVMPAAQAGVERTKTNKDGSQVTSGAKVTATTGEGVSANAYTKIEGDKGKFHYQAGVTAGYTTKDGTEVKGGVRVDRTGSEKNPYASVVVSDKKGTTAEAGVCVRKDFFGNKADICVGVQHNMGRDRSTSFVIGLGRSF